MHILPFETFARMAAAGLTLLDLHPKLTWYMLSARTTNCDYGLVPTSKRTRNVRASQIHRPSATKALSLLFHRSAQRKLSSIEGVDCAEETSTSQMKFVAVCRVISNGRQRG